MADDEHHFCAALMEEGPPHPDQARFKSHRAAVLKANMWTPGEIITLLFLPPGEAVVLPERGWVFPAGVHLCPLGLRANFRRNPAIPAQPLQQPTGVDRR